MAWHDSARRARAGEGKARVVDEKQTTVYKRALNEQYHLKMKASRAMLSDISKRYPYMPFPLRKLLAAGSASKFGLVECLNHGLLQAYPVLWEKEGEVVAHIKGTVLLMKNGSDRVTAAPLQEVQSEKSVEVRRRPHAWRSQSLCVSRAVPVRRALGGRECGGACSRRMSRVLYRCGARERGGACRARRSSSCWHRASRRRRSRARRRRRRRTARTRQHSSRSGGHVGLAAVVARRLERAPTCGF